jgi:hypothetical protein
VVYENDEFTAGVVNGAKTFTHNPLWRGDRGEPMLFYCIAVKAGVMDYEIMSFAETEAIKQRSRAKGSGPWVTDDLEMRKKCPIRRMSKRWDLLPEIRDVILAEDDLPADIAQLRPAMARPMFSIPDRSTAPAATEPVDAPPGAEPPTDPEPEPKRPGNGDAMKQAPAPEPTMATDAVKAARIKLLLSMCNREGISVDELSQWLEATGQAEGVSSLDDIPLGVLDIIITGWPTDKKTQKPGIAAMIKAARAGDGGAQ